MSVNKERTNGVIIYDRFSKSYNYHYLMVVLMLLSAILGSTIFGVAQVICEIVLFMLLLYGVFHVKLNRLDKILLLTFLVIFLLSFFKNEFVSFALNFKIFGLFILTLVYFRKIHFYPGKLIFIVHLLNLLLTFHQFVTGHFIVESAWFFGPYKNYANVSPVGLFLAPHANAFFVASFTIYLINYKRKHLQAMFFFSFLLIIGSLTSFVAFMAQMAHQVLNYIMKKINFLKINLGWSTKLAIIAIPFLLLWFYADDLLVFLKQQGGYTRYYSAEIILDQLFDIRFFSDIFNVVPRNYMEYIIEQEATFANFGNEIGLVKIFVEGGFILGLISLYALLSRLKYYNIFIFVSLLHYSFAINMPFMLFLIMMYNHELTIRDSLENSLKGQQLNIKDA